MTVAAQGHESFRFTTDKILPEERLPRWNELFGRPMARRILASPWTADRPYHLRMTGHALDERGSDYESNVMRIEVTSGGFAQRTSALLTDGNDDVVLHIHETGRRIVSQRGREANVEDRGALVTFNAEPSTIVLPEAAHFVSVALPRRNLARLVPRLDDALMRPLPPELGVLRLMRSYLHVLDDEAALDAPDVQRAVAAHVYDLCVLAIGATRDAEEIAKGRGLRAARLRAIKSDIVQNLARNVTADSLGARHGVSARYVYKLFEGEGMSLSRFVLGLRLEQVYRTLTNPAFDDFTVAAIAYRAGFGDLSTFNRDFRRRFSATPSDIRAAAKRKQ